MAPPSVYTYVSPVTVPVSSLNVSLLVSSSVLASLLFDLLFRDPCPLFECTTEHHLYHDPYPLPPYACSCRAENRLRIKGDYCLHRLLVVIHTAPVLSPMASFCIVSIIPPFSLNFPLSKRLSPKSPTGPAAPMSSDQCQCNV